MPDLKMPDLNKVFVAGRLTRDPDLTYIASGKAVCRMALAVSRTYKDRNGERQEDVTFVDVTVWERTAEFCGENLRKGRPILVEGSLKSDQWEDRETGQKRSKVEIRGERVQTLDWEDRGDKPAHKPKAEPEQESLNPNGDDDIPF